MDLADVHVVGHQIRMDLEGQRDSYSGDVGVSEEALRHKLVVDLAEEESYLLLLGPASREGTVKRRKGIKKGRAKAYALEVGKRCLRVDSQGQHWHGYENHAQVALPTRMNSMSVQKAGSRQMMSVAMKWRSFC